MKNNIIEPVLLLDEEKVRRNIRRMKHRAEEAECMLRPHFKTHQSHLVGKWCRDEGIEAITVSSLGMAEYFAAAGWKDILIAFPVNVRQLPALHLLAEKLDHLILMVEHADTVEALHSSGLIVDVVIEVDTGSNRTGVSYNRPEQLQWLVEKVEAAANLTLAGIYSHAGHTYGSRSYEEVLHIGGMALDRLIDVAKKINKPALPLYFGDTPYASIGKNLRQISVMTPGNFVFYDSMQVVIGSCEAVDIAVCLACPVVSLKPERLELAVHAGAVHLSKDNMDSIGFGTVVRFTSEGWSKPLEGCYVRAISQEHGILRMSPEEMGKWTIGDMIGILPIHSCLTAEGMGGYETLKGERVDHYRRE